MAVGRFFCVAFPLVLTLASIIALLVATLSGVTHSSLYVFRINATGLSVDPNVALGDLQSLVGNKAVNARADIPISPATLGLGDLYDVTLWGYCATARDGSRECTKSQFDWASHRLNTTWIENIGAVAGTQIKLPDEVKEALKAFRTLTKWTEVAYIAALVALGVELFIGIFASFSRAASCVTWLVAAVAAVLVGTAAGAATAMATVVVGTAEATAQAYGIKGSIGGRFLAAVWIAFAFAAGAAFFWLFTICCCKPEHRSQGGFRGRGGRHSSDGEKLMPARGYAPLGNDHEMSGGFADANRPGHLHQPYPPQPPRYPGGTGRADLAYEPYSHRV